MPDFDKIKRDRLIDLFRRAVANPHTLVEVATAVAHNWCPPFKVDSKGKTTVVVSDGSKAPGHG